MKRSQVFLCAGTIFFLTGCVTQGYHTVRDSASAAPVISMDRGAPFHWPLNGQVALGFASKDDGVSLKGIRITAADGGIVQASTGGQVVYVDEKLRGYGKTVILEHRDGFSTVYSGVSEILVRSGEYVRRGQAIAKVGRGGKGNQSQLYFQIRKNSKAEDPLKFLSK